MHYGAVVAKSEGSAVTADVIERINGADRQCMAAKRRVVRSAVKCGRWLAVARQHIRHGGWATWVERHCEFGIRQASEYLTSSGTVTKSDLTCPNWIA